MRGFNFNTISNFDNHICNSIAGYGLLDNLIINICSFYAKKGETIIDLGCTTGRLINKLAEINTDSYCVGIDITDDNFINGEAELIKQDITSNDLNLENPNIVLSIFTLQFIKQSERVELLRKIYNSLNSNGVFIVCEKEINNIGIFQEVFTFSNYDYKKQNFNSDEILQKEEDLRIVMNCLSIGENEKMFSSVGFTRIACFFQSLNFRGWLCMK